MTAPSKVSEKQLQETVVAAARVFGYLVYHTFDSRRSEPGFPDLVIVGELPKVRGRLFFVELKTEQGVLSHEQQTWLGALRNVGTPAGHPTVRVVRPHDLTEFIDELRPAKEKKRRRAA